MTGQCYTGLYEGQHIVSIKTMVSHFKWHIVILKKLFSCHLLKKQQNKQTKNMQWCICYSECYVRYQGSLSPHKKKVQDLILGCGLFVLSVLLVGFWSTWDLCCLDYPVCQSWVLKNLWCSTQKQTKTKKHGFKMYILGGCLQARAEMQRCINWHDMQHKKSALLFGPNDLSTVSSHMPSSLA